MLDFYEVWGKEILKKRIAIAVAVISTFITLGVIFSAFIFSGEEKTVEDYAFVYVVERFNYTPFDVEKAYFSRYQYKPLGYRYTVEGEIEEVKRLKMVSFFKPTSIKVDEETRTVKVTGIRMIGKLKRNKIEDVDIRETTITLKYSPQGFSVEEIK